MTDANIATATILYIITIFFTCILCSCHFLIYLKKKHRLVTIEVILLLPIHHPSTLDLQPTPEAEQPITVERINLLVHLNIVVDCPTQLTLYDLDLSVE